LQSSSLTSEVIFNVPLLLKRPERMLSNEVFPHPLQISHKY
jgi:hypothetical protein